MLPDFASMSGARLTGIDDPEIEAGVAFHHRTDEVFHASPTFVALCQQGTEELESRGVGRGTSRASAHVGVELLLDGHLLADEEAREDYLRAIALPGELGLRFRRGEARFLELRERLATYGLPTDYRSPERVATRLRQILARRPRLAFADGDEARVTPWLQEVRAELEMCLPRLLGEVSSGLERSPDTVDTPRSGRAILSARVTPRTPNGSSPPGLTSGRTPKRGSMSGNARRLLRGIDVG